MPILSIEFALFFLAFFLLYWAVAGFVSVQNLLLLAAGLAWLYWLHPWFLLALCLYTLIIHVIAQNMVFSLSAQARRAWLISGIAAATAILLFFKYIDFLRPLVYAGTQWEIMDILMPLGLSYYVFQSIAYLGAAYKRRIPALRFHELCLHFGFFPTITAGPIFRASRFKSIGGMQAGAAVQLLEPRRLLFPALAISLILLGILKSWVLSAHIDSHFVAPMFDNPQQYSAAALLAAVYGYSIQLFFNFSGYSDLVIGMALLLGFRLPQNFAAPFYAVNIRDFWNRWHISLSTWIRDYLYIPLGGSRQGFTRAQLNLLIAFGLSGIWHGSGWCFFLWGILHALALISLNIKELFFGKIRRRAYWQKLLGIVLTFNFISFSFILFAVPSLGEAGDFLRALLNNPNSGHAAEWLWIAAVYVGILLYPLWAWCLQSIIALFKRLPPWLWFAPIALALQAMIYLAPEGIPGFLYANF